MTRLHPIPNLHLRLRVSLRCRDSMFALPSYSYSNSNPACVPNGDPESSPGLRELGDRCPGLFQPTYPCPEGAPEPSHLPLLRLANRISHAPSGRMESSTTSPGASVVELPQPLALILQPFRPWKARSRDSIQSPTCIPEYEYDGGIRSSPCFRTRTRTRAHSHLPPPISHNRTLPSAPPSPVAFPHTR